MPFRQLDDSTTRRFEGTGLGLSIVRNLAQAMGGEVGADGALGEGARFWFEVPMPRVAAREPTSSEPEPLAGGIGPDTPRISGRVLLVEDREDNRVIVGAMLELLGVEHETAQDGEQAVARVMAEPFDAVLMDVHRPKVDGYAATEQIRAWESSQCRDPGVPIIALTAGAFPRDRQRCFEAGMDDYLAKPVDMAKLGATLGMHLPAGTRSSAGGRDAVPVGGASEGPRADTAVLAERLRALLPLFAQARFDAVTGFEQLEQLAVGSDLAPPLAALRPAVQEFRFAQVHRALSDLLTAGEEAPAARDDRTGVVVPSDGLS